MTGDMPAFSVVPQRKSPNISQPDNLIAADRVVAAEYRDGQASVPVGSECRDVNRRRVAPRHPAPIALGCAEQG